MTYDYKLNTHQATTQVKNAIFLGSQKPQEPLHLNFCGNNFPAPHPAPLMYFLTVWLLFFCVFPHVRPCIFAEISGRDWLPIFGADSLHRFVNLYLLDISEYFTYLPLSNKG